LSCVALLSCIWSFSTCEGTEEHTNWSISLVSAWMHCTIHNRRDAKIQQFRVHKNKMWKYTIKQDF
jgi:hypothetical protein